MSEPLPDPRPSCDAYHKPPAGHLVEPPEGGLAVRAFVLKKGHYLPRASFVPFFKPFKKEIQVFSFHEVLNHWPLLKHPCPDRCACWGIEISPVAGTGLFTPLVKTL